MLIKRVMLVAITLLAAAGAALFAPGAVSPAAAATQGSCQTGLLRTIDTFGVSCTALPDSLKYFAWVQCTNNVWGFGPTEPGTSGVNSFAQCPNGHALVQEGLNINQGVCPVITDESNYSEVACTALPDGLKYFGWVDCYSNVWAFGPTEPGTSGVYSLAFCPSGHPLVQGGFNVA